MGGDKREAAVAKDGEHLVKGEIGVIVLLAEVRQKKMLGAALGKPCGKQGTVGIAKMSVTGQDSLLQVIRIGARSKHFHVVIGFDDHGLASKESCQNLVGNVSHVGGVADTAEASVFLPLHTVAYAAGAIVGRRKGTNGHVTHREGE